MVKLLSRGSSKITFFWYLLIQGLFFYRVCPMQAKLVKKINDNFWLSISTFSKTTGWFFSSRFQPTDSFWEQLFLIIFSWNSSLYRKADGPKKPKIVLSNEFTRYSNYFSPRKTTGLVSSSIGSYKKFLGSESFQKGNLFNSLHLRADFIVGFIFDESFLRPCATAPSGSQINSCCGPTFFQCFFCIFDGS